LVSHLADNRHDGPWRKRPAVRTDRVEGVGELGKAAGGLNTRGRASRGIRSLTIDDAGGRVKTFTG
jgi:hypothetical protein